MALSASFVACLHILPSAGQFRSSALPASARSPSAGLDLPFVCRRGGLYSCCGPLACDPSFLLAASTALSFPSLDVLYRYPPAVCVAAIGAKLLELEQGVISTSAADFTCRAFSEEYTLQQVKQSPKLEAAAYTLSLELYAALLSCLTSALTQCAADT